MKSRRFDALVVAQRLATLDLQRARAAFGRALGERAEAAQKLDAVNLRLDALGAHRKALTAGSSLTVDRYAWALVATSDALDEQDTATEALHAKRTAVERHTAVLAAAHRRHDIVSERVDLQRTHQSRTVEAKQQADALETWMEWSGGKS